MADGYQVMDDEQWRLYVKAIGTLSSESLEWLLREFAEDGNVYQGDAAAVADIGRCTGLVQDVLASRLGSRHHDR